jgi:hypothetical protein
LIDGFLRLKIPWVKDPSSHLLIYVCSGSGWWLPASCFMMGKKPMARNIAQNAWLDLTKHLVWGPHPKAILYTQNSFPMDDHWWVNKLVGARRLHKKPKADGGESAPTSTHHELHMGFMHKGVSSIDLLLMGVDSLGPHLWCEITGSRF